ncbi:unnamed protein product [Mycetohabitans rhizoxinica HKI 454]|uniref:Uncharacterized protein n=1 Tax=Mycetohabitans rhizoxinica (strain DSM 19002 / CIP 109453 / HKI 454) TaxID=882378 RepID=E5APS7_MYCRK|nr:unnamed protein product [Mycetohabitans rhizoxinica HKI 454]
MGANGLENSRLNAASRALQSLQRMSRWIKQQSQLVNTETINQLEIRNIRDESIGCQEKSIDMSPIIFITIFCP